MVRIQRLPLSGGQLVRYDILQVAFAADEADIQLDQGEPGEGPRDVIIMHGCGWSGRATVLQELTSRLRRDVPEPATLMDVVEFTSEVDDWNMTESEVELLWTVLRLLPLVDLILISEASVPSAGFLPFVLQQCQTRELRAPQVIMTEATRRLLEPIYMSLFAGLTEGLYVSDTDPDGSRRSYALPELLQAEHCPFGKPALWSDVCCLRYNESFGIRVEESWIPFSAHATPEQLTHLRHLPLFTVQPVNCGLFLGACGWRLRFGLQSSVTLLMDGLASAPVFLTSPASSAVTKATACLVRSPIPDDGILDSTKLLDLISNHVKSTKTGNMLLVLPSLPDALHVLDILATEGPSLLPVVLAISKIDSFFASVRGLADWANEAALEVFIHSRESPLDQVLNSRSGPPIFTASDLPEARTILKTLRSVRSLVVTGPTLSGRGLPLDVFLEFFAGDSESVVITAEGEPSLPDLVLLKCSVTPIPDVKLRELFELTVDLDEDSSSSCDNIRPRSSERQANTPYGQLFDPRIFQWHDDTLRMDKEHVDWKEQLRVALGGHLPTVVKCSRATRPEIICDLTQFCSSRLRPLSSLPLLTEMGRHAGWRGLLHLDGDEDVTNHGEMVVASAAHSIGFDVHDATVAFTPLRSLWSPVQTIRSRNMTVLLQRVTLDLKPASGVNFLPNAPSQYNSTWSPWNALDVHSKSPTEPSLVATSQPSTAHPILVMDRNPLKNLPQGHTYKLENPNQAAVVDAEGYAVTVTHTPGALTLSGVYSSAFTAARSRLISSGIFL